MATTPAAGAALSPQKESREGKREKGAVGGWRMFVFGGLSAQVAALFTNPIDVVKIRLQLQGEGIVKGGKGHHGLFAMFGSVYREEGLLAFWKGVVPSLLREITYSSIRLGAYEPIRNFLCSSGEDQSRIPLWKKLIAGAAAGAVGSGLANPVDLVKVQQQAVVGNNPEIRNGRTLAMLHNIYKQQGVQGLFRGVVPTVQRAALLTATQLGTYDEIKHTLLRAELFEEGPLLHFCSGSIAGLGVSLVTSPVDTVRTRVMNQPVDPVSRRGQLYSNSLDCALKTAKLEGVLALYKGFFAQWLRVGPHTTISLVCFEALRHVFGLKAI